MGISVCRLSSFFSLELSSLSKLESVDRTGLPRDIFARVMVQWYWLVYSFCCAPSFLPFSELHLSLCMVLAAMCFSQRSSRRGREEGSGALSSEEWRTLYLKRQGLLRGWPLSASPLIPHVSGPLSLGGGRPPPPTPSLTHPHTTSTRRFVTVSHLRDWSRPA